MVNVTAAVSDRRRGKRPPRLTAYAYVQRRAAPGVTRHYTFAACYLSRVRENERSWSAAQPGGNAAAMDHGGTQVASEGQAAKPASKEHGGKAAVSKEHGGKPAAPKEHTGKAVPSES